MHPGSPFPSLGLKDAAYIVPASAVILHHGASDLRAAFDGQLDRETPRQLVRLGILRHCVVIHVTSIEVFPPYAVAALAQVPGDDPVTILLERIRGMTPPFQTQWTS